jgi:hypothetical protein
MAYTNPNLSYPKPRSNLIKVIPFARTDSATQRAWLPKDAVVCNLTVYQATGAVTAAGAVSVGLNASNTALINAAALPVTSAGAFTPGAATGASFLTKLAADSVVTTTYTVGSSTAGGTGWVIIEYFVPGPGEANDD